MEPFTIKHSPAENVNSLLDYLEAHDSNDFVYRGQVREWPGPLLPSAFRHYRHTGCVYTRDSPEYQQHAMRMVGNSFYGVKRFTMFRDIVLSLLDDTYFLDQKEEELLYFISHNDKIAQRLSVEPFIDVVSRGLRPDAFEKYKSKFTSWEKIISHRHKTLIRLNACNQFLGFAIGQTVAQQYIESSEYLDVTSSPLIAAFFATHEGPSLSQYADAATAHKNNEHIGIIYRFDISWLDRNESLTYNYYSAPPYIDAVSQLQKLECSPHYIEDWDPKFFVINYLETDGQRDFKYLRLPHGTIKNSRLGRQHAGFIVPDELHIETRDQYGDQNVSFQAIEDLGLRYGVTKFYFYHSPDDEQRINISSYDLWPVIEEQDKFFIELVHHIIFGWQKYEQWMNAISPLSYNIVVQPPHLWIPPRPDLVGSGPYRYDSASNTYFPKTSRKNHIP